MERHSVTLSQFKRKKTEGLSLLSFGQTRYTQYFFRNHNWSHNNEVRNKIEQLARGCSILLHSNCQSIYQCCGGHLRGFHQKNIRFDCNVIFFPQIYDTATGHKILTLHDSNNTNNYSKNLASFNPTDDLVLNDGVLWDVKGKRVIHKFDKFNNFVSGVFHPSGLEIIINSEIVSLKKYQSLTSLFLSITDPNK